MVCNVMTALHAKKIQAVDRGGRSILREVVDGKPAVDVLLQLIAYFIVLILQPVALQTNHAHADERGGHGELQRPEPIHA